MALASIPLRIAQVSDIHCGTLTFEPRMMESVVERVNHMRPDLVIVVGDLTAEGYEWEFEEAASWIGRFDAPRVVVPGNHDARNIGYVHFQRHFGDRYSCYRQRFDDERAERLQASGVTVVAVDSSVPDLNEGHVGREWYGWMREQFAAPDDVKILVIHHHLVAIPATGRERNLITDASTIKVYTHYENGRRGLSVIRTRANRATIREAFLLTDAFKASNPLQMD